MLKLQTDICYTVKKGYGSILMDIKEKINELVEKIKNDKNLASKFAKDPIGTVENLIGIDLPNEQLEPIVEGIKAKINIDSIGDVLGNIGGLFGKK